MRSTYWVASLSFCTVPVPSPAVLAILTIPAPRASSSFAFASIRLGSGPSEAAADTSAACDVTVLGQRGLSPTNARIDALANDGALKARRWTWFSVHLDENFVTRPNTAQKEDSVVGCQLVDAIGDH